MNAERPVDQALAILSGGAAGEPCRPGRHASRRWGLRSWRLERARPRRCILETRIGEIDLLGDGRGIGPGEHHFTGEGEGLGAGAGVAERSGVGEHGGVRGRSQSRG